VLKKYKGLKPNSQVLVFKELNVVKSGISHINMKPLQSCVFFLKLSNVNDVKFWQHKRFTKFKDAQGF